MKLESIRKRLRDIICFRGTGYYLIKVRNSSLVFWLVLKQPNMQEVVVIEPSFCTPRMVIHM